MIRIGEICLLTNDVIRLSDFYKKLLEVYNHSEDATHQFILEGEISFSIYNDGTIKNNDNRNMCMAFTVEDMENAYQKVVLLGGEILEHPTKRPWGATNMSFYDPDHNVVYLRSMEKNMERDR